MNKKGQFFIIAALVVIVALLGFGVVYSSTRAVPEEQKAYDLLSEINYETNQVLDYGVYNSLDESQRLAKAQELASIYKSNHPDTEFALAVGNSQSVLVISNEFNDLGTQGIGTGGGTTGVNIRVLKTTTTRNTPTEGRTNVTIGNITRSFSLNPGDNVYVIVSKEKEDNKVVASTKK